MKIRRRRKEGKKTEIREEERKARKRDEESEKCKVQKKETIFYKKAEINQQ